MRIYNPNRRKSYKPNQRTSKIVEALTDSQKTEICNAWLQNMKTPHELASEYGVSARAIRFVIKDSGIEANTIPLRPKRAIKQWVIDLRVKWASGNYTHEQLAQEYEISTNYAKVLVSGIKRPRRRK